MKCNSKEKDNAGQICQSDAIKQCRHEFATCGRHSHGCKNEEEGEV